MFKCGDKVVFKYPERSTWSDTPMAISEGVLTVGGVYKVRDMDGSKTVCLFGNPGKGYWSLSAACVVLFPKIKRNLPNWF